MTLGSITSGGLRALCRSLFFAGLLLVPITSVAAQVTPEEHESHHPEENAGASSDLTSGNSAAGGGMGAQMDGMMEKMRMPAPKALYPELMSLPDLTPERRAEIGAKARKRMQTGVGLISEGLTLLSDAVPGEDLRQMQLAVAKFHEGLSRFESGLAAQRALAENQAPDRMALKWFKKELNLSAVTKRSSLHPFGGTRFHLATIAVLSAFSLAVIVAYFWKMRRISELLQKLATAQTSGSDTPVVETESSVPITAAPRGQQWSGELRSIRITRETPDVKTFHLCAQSGEAVPFTYVPGQFLTLSLFINGARVKRCYTIASAPSRTDFCAITVKREEQGLVSRYLHDHVTEGDSLSVAAPAGTFTFDGTEADSIVLLGGGVGITPLMSVIRYLTDTGWQGEIDLLYCCRSPEDYIFRDEIEQLAHQHRNFRATVTMTRAAEAEWTGLRGRFNTEVVKQYVPDIARRRSHVCGPAPMMAAFVEILRALDVPDALVKAEAFGPAQNRVATVSAPGHSSRTVKFTRSGKLADLGRDQTVLDVAESIGVDIESSCRSGQCGSCRVKLLSGRVEMKCKDALSEAELREGFILACQAHARQDLEIEA